MKERKNEDFKDFDRILKILNLIVFLFNDLFWDKKMILSFKLLI